MIDHYATTNPLRNFLSPAVAGKKGRVMERRILKDFQIGFVEGILNETFNNTTEKPADVFGTIAKAIGNRTSAKK